MRMTQTPPPGTRVLRVAGDVLTFRLEGVGARAGNAVLRTNLGRAAVRRRELMRHTEADDPLLARDWHDIPMQPTEEGGYQVRIPLTEVGWFAAKTCFIPKGSTTPVWPEGDDLVIKVGSAVSCRGNSIYTAFVRQFGPALRASADAAPVTAAEDLLDECGYTVIPPSGTFRDLIKQLDTILGRMRFGIVQLLPIHPTPTTYARMGRFGSPFAGLDFLSVDPALAEFDRKATPLDQYRELIDAIHARGARLFMDLPANHTGWASTLQTHHPDWFRRRDDGAFVSPGAWGVTWEDLAELDYTHPQLREYMARVFEFWCEQGVDGFRCDAGYMVPADTWSYIVARVRNAFPDTVFLLEGLGGKVTTTDRLLSASNLDWAYSELFQTDTRGRMEAYLPGAIALSEATGPLVHFAETHDNNRMAARSPRFARMRTALAALLSQQGAFGITNGVEWFALTKVDVHGASPLAWGAEENQVDAIGRLNALLRTHPAFGHESSVHLVTQGGGDAIAVQRDGEHGLLVLVNLDPDAPQSVGWPASITGENAPCIDLLSGRRVTPAYAGGGALLELAPAEVLCLTRSAAELDALEQVCATPVGSPGPTEAQRRRVAALRLRAFLGEEETLGASDPAELADQLMADPLAFCRQCVPTDAYPPVVHWQWPQDERRVVMLPPGHVLLIESPHPFRAALAEDARVLCREDSLPRRDGGHFACLIPPDRPAVTRPAELCMASYEGARSLRARGTILRLCAREDVRVQTRFSGPEVRSDGVYALLTNGRGAMAQVRACWGEIATQYDALLAANLHAAVPVDRHVLWTRCRGWVVNCGYSHAIDATCLEHFEASAGDGRATWHFHVPVGMGRRVPLTLSLRMSQGQNRVVLNVTRDLESGDSETLADTCAVQVILRPDIESRGFHEKTKAFTGPEREWPGALTSRQAGFAFRPARAPGLDLAADLGSYHHAPEWSYMVAHPVDAERGLGECGDLFSPGYFEAELQGGQRLHLTAELLDDPCRHTARARTVREKHNALDLEVALERAMADYVVHRDALYTVIAGYPWFLDWGRDTLIALRGLIAGGRTDVALDILREFGRFEKGGTLPNMIRGDDDSNRDTSDAPLWYFVACRDLMEVLGAESVLGAACGERPLKSVLHSIAENYRGGTANGIHMDAESGLVFSPSHFTWMDTNFPAGTPRMGYPVEIQALWTVALDMMEGLAPRKGWGTLAKRVRKSLRELFFRVDDGFLADCLHASAGTPAARAVADDALRSNQLLTVTLGALDDPGMARAVLHACECLIVPGGIRSLADRPVTVALPVEWQGRLLNDPAAPYWGRYSGDEDTCRKPAYHNGTAWTWLFPSYAEGLVICYGDSARAAALSILGGSVDILNHGCAGQVPEILDGDAPHDAKGCGAQAWGVTELYRVHRRVSQGALQV